MELTLLSEPSLNVLFSIIVARHIGARGASKEQYLETMHSASSRLNSAQLPSDKRKFGPAFVREAKEVLATTHALQFSIGAAPLCSEVQWKIIAPRRVPDAIVAWLDELPNVEVERP